MTLYCREEEAIKLDGLNVAQMKELRDKAEKHAFQAEVDRMMKLIINSLYKNKEVSNLEASLCWEYYHHHLKSLGFSCVGILVHV